MPLIASSSDIVEFIDIEPIEPMSSWRRTNDMVGALESTVTGEIYVAEMNWKRCAAPNWRARTGWGRLLRDCCLRDAMKVVCGCLSAF